MITEIEMRYAINKDETSNVCGGLVKFEALGHSVTIHEPESGRAVEMSPQAALDLANAINKMLEIVGGKL